MKHHMLVEGQTFKYRVFLVIVFVFVVVCTFFFPHFLFGYRDCLKV